MFKHFIFIFTLIALLLGLFFYQVRENEVKVVKQQLAFAEMAHVKMQERVLHTFFIGHFSDVGIISELNELKKIASGSKDYTFLEHDFLSFSEIRGIYDQIRYLDKNGVEKIRIDLKDGKPCLLAKKFLQDKSNRYYFVAIQQLKPGQIYLSPLDLNVEKQKIELPFKPMLRIGAPIFDQSGEFQGALIINYLAAPMLQAFKKSGSDSHGENSLLNYEGFWLSSENLENEWGFMLPERLSRNFVRLYPAAWKKIISGGNGQFEDPAGLFTFATFNPQLFNPQISSSYSYHLTTSFKVGESQTSYPWKIVSLVNTSRLQQTIAQKLKHKETLWFGFFGLIFFLSGYLLWVLLKSRQKELEQQKRIVKLNTSLEIRIEERTQQLNKSNKKLSTIIKTTSQGFIMFDGEVQVVEINPAMLTMLGRPSSEVVGKSWFELAGVKNYDLLHRVVALRKKGFSGNYDLEIPRPDGSSCSCNISATPLRNEIDEVEGSFVLVSDISKRLEFEENLKKAIDEAEKNSAAKTLFLSSMSHEFRTPMNSILGFAQLLADEDSLGAKEKNFVEKILVSGDHLKILINDILDLAKIEAGAVEINLVDVNLCSTIQNLVSMIEPLAKAREIKLIAGETETRYMIRADSLRFQQIILNLLDNAVKYNRIGGHVQIFCTKLDEEWIRFNVVDDGPGIAPDKRPFLFQPFNRLGAETSSVQGSGVGLVISKNLAELMGCRLGLLDKDDPGCHFYFDLPIVGEAPAVELNTPMPELETSSLSFASSASSEPPAKESYSCTLLYIEDNELNRMLLASIIEKRPSFALLSAVDGRQGVEMALRLRPDLILVDIGLPDIDGFAVLQELQKHPETRKIPLVALSGNASKEDIEKAYVAGFVGYLTKPLNIGLLFETLDGILLAGGTLASEIEDL